MVRRRSLDLLSLALVAAALVVVLAAAAAQGTRVNPLLTSASGLAPKAAPVKGGGKGQVKVQASKAPVVQKEQTCNQLINAAAGAANLPMRINVSPTHSSTYVTIGGKCCKFEEWSHTTQASEAEFQRVRDSQQPRKRWNDFSREEKLGVLTRKLAGHQVTDNIEARFCDSSDHTTGDKIAAALAKFNGQHAYDADHSCIQFCRDLSNDNSQQVALNQLHTAVFG